MKESEHEQPQWEQTTPSVWSASTDSNSGDASGEKEDQAKFPCQSWVKLFRFKSSLTNHQRAWPKAQMKETERTERQRERRVCEGCGVWINKTNITRHCQRLRQQLRIIRNKDLDSVNFEMIETVFQSEMSLLDAEFMVNVVL